VQAEMVATKSLFLQEVISSTHIASQGVGFVVVSTGVIGIVCSVIIVGVIIVVVIIVIVIVGGINIIVTVIVIVVIVVAAGIICISTHDSSLFIVIGKGWTVGSKASISPHSWCVTFLSHVSHSSLVWSSQKDIAVEKVSLFSFGMWHLKFIAHWWVSVTVFGQLLLPWVQLLSGSSFNFPNPHPSLPFKNSTPGVVASRLSLLLSVHQHSKSHNRDKVSSVKSHPQWNLHGFLSHSLNCQISFSVQCCPCFCLGENFRSSSELCAVNEECICGPQICTLIFLCF